MSIPRFSVRRPITVTMVFLGIMMLGVISWFKLPVELFPSINYPQLTIVTRYENAAPEEVETLITRLVEESVGSVPRLKRIQSVSKEGISLVIADFLWGTHMDFASLNIREKIDLIKERLPRGSEDPLIIKFNPFQPPVMILSVTGSHAPVKLRQLAKKLLKDELEKVDGVASINISGGLEREVLVEIDQGRTQASKLSLVEVAEALERTNLNYPAGTISESFYEYLIRTIGEFQFVREIPDTVITVEKEEDEERRDRPVRVGEEKPIEDRRLIYLSDIATVKDTVRDRTSFSRYNSRENISLAIQKQAGTNTLTVIRGVRKALRDLDPEIKRRQIQVETIMDQSRFIQDAVNGVRDAALQGALLAAVVLFFFIPNLRMLVIVNLGIPVAILSTFAMMYFGGLTLNIMSLGGIALGVGMMTDSAIVVIENIFRQRSLGLDAKESAVVGTEEVAGAITASILTNLAVFLPMIFVIGIAGQMVKDIAFTVVFSLLASLAVAMSLIPRYMVKGADPAALTREMFWLRFLRAAYRGMLEWVLEHRALFWMGVLVLIAASVPMLLSLDRELMPRVDQREVFVKVDLPTGTRLDVTNNKIRAFEQLLADEPAVESMAVRIGSEKEKALGESIDILGSHQSQVVIRLKRNKTPWERPRWDQSAAFVQKLKARVDSQTYLKDAYFEFLVNESVFQAGAAGESSPIVIEVRGKDLSQLETLAKQAQQMVGKVRGIYGIKTTVVPPSPETKVRVRKDRAAQYNLSVRDIALTAQIAVKGAEASKFKEQGEEYTIRVRLRPQDRANFRNVGDIMVHSPLGAEVPLKELCVLSQGTGPSEIKRLDQNRIIQVFANIYGRSQREILEEIDARLRGISVPSGYTVALTGEQEEMKESFRSLWLALILAVTFVYMIMAAQFESLLQPFLIMFSIPLSTIGIALGLFATQTPLSVMVLLGMIMLGGIVVNNGIVLIDFVNQMRQEGKDLVSAVQAAADLRLRPILMTTITTLIGLLPLALGWNEGARLQAPMAVTVIGGLTASTFLTLLVIPLAYVQAEGWLLRWRPQSQDAAPMAPGGLAFAGSAAVPGVLPTLETTVEIPPIEGEKLSYLKPPSKPAPPSESPTAPEDEEVPHGVLKLPPEEIPGEKVIEKFGPKAQGLNARQLRLLEYLQKARVISRRDYAESFQISVPTAARDLKELTDRGLIRPVGSFGAGRKYELI